METPRGGRKGDATPDGFEAVTRVTKGIWGTREAQMKLSIALCIIVAVRCVKPSGLFGRPVVTRV